MADDKEQSLFQAPPVAEQERMVEAILFATAEPVTVAELNARMPHGADAAEALTKGAACGWLRWAMPGRCGRRPTLVS